MKTKFLFIFLLAAIVLFVLPDSALADSAEGEYGMTVHIDITNGGSDTLTPGDLENRVTTAVGHTEYTIFELYIDSTVSGSLDAADIAYLNRQYYIRVLDVADTITVGNIGDDFFFSRNSDSSFSQLTDVNFPAESFGDYAFYDCDALVNVTLPNAVSFGDYAFGCCEYLETVNMSSVETFGTYAMELCYELKTVNMPSVLSFGHNAFQGCSNALTDISLPLVQSFGDYAFYYCQVLKNVDLPQATAFGAYAFRSCIALERIHLPSATTFGTVAFDRCTNLIGAALPSAQTVGNSAFNGCASLQSVTFGDTVPVMDVYYQVNMDIYVPAASLSAYDSATAPADDNMWEDQALYPYHTDMQYDANDADGGSVPVDSTVYALGDDVVLMDNVNTLTKDRFTFTGWNTKSDLTGIHYNAGDTITFVCGNKLYAEFELDETGIVNITSDTGATISAGELQTRVETVLGAANVAGDIIELRIDSSVSGGLNLTDIAYINTMVNIEVLEVGDTIIIDNTYAVVGDNFLRYSPNIREVTFPGKGFGNDSFRDCTLLTSVNLFEAVTFWDRAFLNCISLTNLNMPEAVTFGDLAFQDCDAITEIILPKAQTFGINAFKGCNVLDSLVLPSARTFGNNAFQYCGSITQMTLGGTVPSIESWGNSFVSGSLYVPTSAVTAYDEDSEPSADGKWNGFTIYTNTSVTHTLTYDVSNAEGTAPIDSSSPYEYGDVVTVLHKTASFSKDGYAFAGWNTEQDGSGVQYNEGDIFHLVEDTVLYSQWTTEVHTVTYDLNGIAGSAPVDENSPYAHGTPVTTDSTVFNRDNYDDIGWNTTSTGSGTQYDKGETFLIYYDTVLYVEWCCQISYDDNGADSGMIPNDASNYHEGDNAQVLDALIPLNKEGCVFEGWNTAADGSGTTYQAGDMIAMSGHLMLYAKWNSQPSRVSSVDAQETKFAQVDKAYVIDLTAVFQDADGDTLTFEVSVGEGDYTSCDANYSYTPTEIGNTIFTFRCNDGLTDSEDTYEVTVCAVNSDIIQDDVIDLLDIGELAQHYNTVFAAYDQNGDDFINLYDIVVVAKFID